MKIEITVLMSVYNGEKHLEKAINSILLQTFKYFEFVIIDDGSDDNSADIIKKFRDERINFIQNKKNIGLTKSLNKGINNAKGEFIARIDADDIALPERLEVQYRFMKQNPGYGLISSCISSINEKDEVKRELCSHLNSEDIFYLLHFRNCLAHSSVMFRAKLVIEAGGYDENIHLAQDYDLWERLSKLTRCHEEKRILSYWRDSEDNISSKNLTDQRKIVYKVSSRGIKKIAGKQIEDDEINMIHKFEFSPIKDIYSLKRVLQILDKINSAIMINEISTINEINLDLTKLERSMKKKSGDLIYHFFRNNTFPLNLKIFLYLDFKNNLSLIKEILKRVLKKSGMLSLKKYHGY